MAPLGGTVGQSGYRHNTWCGKPRIAWLSEGEKNVEDMITRFDITHA